jgi:uncharacterized membrane protein
MRITMLKRISVALATIGLADSMYLTWIKLAQREALCSGIGSCEVVNSSQYAELAGIPIALFGALAFLTILFSLLFDNRVRLLQDNGLVFVFGLSLAGVLYSIYLTYIELFVINAICPFCVLSALCLVGLLYISTLRLRHQWREV